MTLAANPGAVCNENSSSFQDFRVEGGTTSHKIFSDATDASDNLAILAASAPDFEEMDRGLFFGNADTVPTTSPVGGGFMYSEAGGGTWLGTSGTETVFGPAGPHCGACGADVWRVAATNKGWGISLHECGWCGKVYKEGAEISPVSAYETAT